MEVGSDRVYTSKSRRSHGSSLRQTRVLPTERLIQGLFLLVRFQSEYVSSLSSKKTAVRHFVNYYVQKLLIVQENTHRELRSDGHRTVNRPTKEFHGVCNDK